jgi:serralysin
MEYDIRAIQYLYGANRTRNSENNTYEFETGKDYLATIWDTGGHDTIVWKTSGRPDAGVIDLRAGHWSHLGNAVRYFDSESKLIGFDKDTVALLSG